MPPQDSPDTLSRRNVLRLSGTAVAAGIGGCSVINGGSTTTPRPDPTLVIQWLDIRNATEETPTVEYELRRDGSMVFSDSHTMDPVDGRKASLFRRAVPESMRVPGIWELTAEFSDSDVRTSYRSDPAEEHDPEKEYFMVLDYAPGIGLHVNLLSPSDFSEPS